MRGSHKWVGGMPNFIIRAIISRKLRVMFFNKILEKIIENIIINEAMIWIIK